jgi:glucans biosynthesis protein C
MFRMSAFFLIAGFFGRMMLERRGALAFARDRAKRILVPLVVGLPVVSLLTAGGIVAGAWLAGLDLGAYFASLQQAAEGKQGGGAGAGGLGHFWFLYYLLMFYALALLLRAASGSSGGADSRLRRAADAAVRFVMRGYRAPLLLGLPVAAYLWQLEGWASWTGLPAPFPLVPQLTAVLGYGVAFGLGWLLHRQTHLLMDLRTRWPGFLTAAAALTVVAYLIAGPVPRWESYLEGGTLALYAAAYMVGVWCWVVGLTGAAIRFLSAPSPVRRYIADASYWLYLTHVAVLAFFAVLFGPLDWHWGLKFTLTLLGTVPILLLSYHYLVRYTFIGAILNGRRHPRVDRGVSPTAPTPPARA